MDTHPLPAWGDRSRAICRVALPFFGLGVIVSSGSILSDGILGTEIRSWLIDHGARWWIGLPQLIALVTIVLSGAAWLAASFLSGLRDERP